MYAYCLVILIIKLDDYSLIYYLILLLQVVTKASNAYPKDAEAPPCGLDDMTKLAYLHEPGVLQNLKSRYDMNEIYVSIRCKIYPSWNLLRSGFRFCLDDLYT